MINSLFQNELWQCSQLSNKTLVLLPLHCSVIYLPFDKAHPKIHKKFPAIEHPKRYKKATFSILKSITPTPPIHLQTSQQNTPILPHIFK